MKDMFFLLWFVGFCFVVGVVYVVLLFSVDQLVVCCLFVVLKCIVYEIFVCLMLFEECVVVGGQVIWYVEMVDVRMGVLMEFVDVIKGVINVSYECWFNYFKGMFICRCLIELFVGG